jgi:hypothetical protein
MTANGRPGRPVVFDLMLATRYIFARGPDDQLLYVRTGDHGFVGSKEGGELVGDPTAVLTGDGPHVFARCAGGRLLHWSPVPPARPGQEEPVQMSGPADHGWHTAYDPVAVWLPNREIAIFARGAKDELMHWGLSADGAPIGPAVSLGGSVVSTPAVVVRGDNEPDVFTRASDGSIDWHGSKGWKRLGSGASGGPVAVSWGPNRLDVLAPSVDPDPKKSHLLHWGFDTVKGWFGPDFSDLGNTERLACASAPQKNHARLFARDTEGHLQRWLWDAEAGSFTPEGVGWPGPEQITNAVVASPPGVIEGSERVFAWVGDGMRLFEFGKEGSGWTTGEQEIEWIAFSPEPGLELPVEIDLLLSRPEDLLRLGVSWSGFEVVDGDPPTLTPAGNGPPTLRLVLPPQHIAEQVLGVSEAFDPTSTLATAKAGPSQLVFDVAASPIPLTTAGILAAARNAPLRGSEPGSTDLDTFLELPWQLFVAPNGAVATHPTDVVAEAEVVALWRTSLRSASGELDLLRAGGEDEEEFNPALNGPMREQLAAQSTPAHFERLELSSLGGTLRASGDWDGLQWRHDATLGRDNRVRLDMRGLLYPYGHKAVFTTITERRLTDEEPVGVLRQRKFITVIEPTRGRPDDEEAARAFPFDEVTITATLFDNVTDDWAKEDAKGKGKRVAKPSTSLPGEIAAAQEELASLPDVSRRIAVIERLLKLEEQFAALREILSAPVNLFFCPHVGDALVEFPLTCKLGDQSVSFATPMLFVADERFPETPVFPAYDTLVDDNVQAHLATEWATIGSGARPGNPPAKGDSVLRDDHYAGTVTLSGRSLNLLRPGGADEARPVHRIYVSADPHGREFRPQLGPAAVLRSGIPQPAWGIDMELPSLRQLLPDRPEAHRALTAFSRDYLQQGAVADVVHDVVGPAEAIVGDAGALVDATGKAIDQVRGIAVDFTRSAERSGGLVAPKQMADGLSRLAGPVNLKGLTSLNPKDMFDDAATLLGFPLADLLGPLKPDGLPTITTDLSGAQPVATMVWPPYAPGTPPDKRPRQELTLHPPFGLVDDPAEPETPKPTLALEVRSVGTEVRTECSVRDFALSLPTGEPLLKLKFKEVRYVQEAGKPPALAVDKLDASFSGALDLLAVLQEKVGLGDAAPKIRVENSAVVASYSLPVPDAEAGAFVMRNLGFGASITVPFGGDPVVVALGFASRAMPFNLSVMMFGGGGYIDIELDHNGLRRLEIVLEFGASIGVDFVIAKGEAHVLGGIRFELLESREAKVVGYLRIGGSLEVLGLVSVSVELVLSLGYETEGNRLTGRATLVLELDLTLFSESVELDSGPWEITGGDPAKRSERRVLFAASDDPYLDLVREHRAAFRSAADG